ncbi:GPW/gp25 family protein [uncultured Stenotrophomonas sp.]|uniref:GPW/gp25 family protein n=1 Tax=uncultured Stenotrophomonas sp. TaxID=165438 RepID=UPI0028D5F821|nr:GPW/gp25 family protein [uncultured Stenotrophomonas sp.]
MIGMDARSGAFSDDTAHLRQSIADILTTPIGSRIERREYGSLLSELIDQPFNDATRLKLFGAAATALLRWEPRIRLTRIGLTRANEPGTFVLDLDGQRAVPTGASRTTRLSVPLRFRTP